MIQQVPPLTPTAGPRPTPIPFTTTAPPTSERSVLAAALDKADAKAQKLGGTLGAVIVDLNSGIAIDRNGDQSLPMSGLQKLLIAAIVYGAVDEKTQSAASVDDLLTSMLVQGDDAAENALTQRLGGIDVVNAALRNLGYDRIVARANDDGVATPLAMAQALADIFGNRVLRPVSRGALMKTLAAVKTSPRRLRAGLPGSAQVMHIPGTIAESGSETEVNDAGIVTLGGRTLIVVAMLNGGKGTEAQRDDVVAEVGRAAASAVATLNP